MLLRNEGDLLPLSPSTGHIAVLGPCADDVRLLQGDYHYPTHLEIIYRNSGTPAAEVLPRPEETGFTAGPFFPPSVTPLEGIRAAVSPQTRVEHARGCGVLSTDDSEIPAAVEKAARADVAIVFVGGRSGLVEGCTSGEFRDAADLGLTGLQQRLVDEVLATGTPTVVALIGGRAFAVPEIAARAPALLECWIPGEEGGHAIADILFGSACPSGRLPVTLVRHVGQVPLYYNRTWNEGSLLGLSGDYVDVPSSPLFPFGHGLSYTRFSYEAFKAERSGVTAGEAIRLSVEIGNEGDRGGEEVVQLYASDPVASSTRPITQLVGFARVPLEAGRRCRIHFSVDPSQLAFFDRGMRLIVEPGEIRFAVGASSEDLRDRVSVQIQGEARTLRMPDIRPTDVQIESI